MPPEIRPEHRRQRSQRLPDEARITRGHRGRRLRAGAAIVPQAERPAPRGPAPAAVAFGAKTRLPRVAEHHPGGAGLKRLVNNRDHPLQNPGLIGGRCQFLGNAAEAGQLPPAGLEAVLDLRHHARVLDGHGDL